MIAFVSVTSQLHTQANNVWCLTNLSGFDHDPEHKSQVDQVKGTEYVLGQLNVRPLAANTSGKDQYEDTELVQPGDVVENGVDPHKAGRIDQRPCIPS